MISEEKGSAVTISYSDECTAKLDEILERSDLAEKLPVIQLAIAVALVGSESNRPEVADRSGRGYTINRGSLDPNGDIAAAIRASGISERYDVADSYRILGEHGITVLFDLIVSKHMRLSDALDVIINPYRAG